MFITQVFSTICFLLISTTCYSMTWQDLWWRKDQQAMHLLKKGRVEQAAKVFESSSWKGVANYRLKNYSQAESLFMQSNNATSKYNLGNAYAMQGKYEEAISAYNEALKIDSKMQDAIYNRELIKKLLKKDQSRNKDPQKKKDQKSKNQNQQATNKEQQDLNNNKSQNFDKEKNSKDKADPKSPSSEEKRNDKTDNKKEEPARNNTVDKELTKNPPNQPAPSQQNISNANEQQKNTHNDNKQTTPSRHKEEQEAKTAKLKERDEETDQWLQQIPDDPGGLLRRKIWRDHLRKTNQTEGN